jgi:hypothetical protein
MKKLFVLCLFFIANTCNAQAINERWLGTWRSVEGKFIQFTSREVLYEKAKYPWIGSKPTKEVMNKNMAFYDGSVKKSEFAEFFKEISSKDLKGSMNQQEILRFQYEQSQTKLALKKISNDTFRTIKITNSTYECDDGCTYFILDKENIYLVSTSYASLPQLSITTFFKDN